MPMNYATKELTASLQELTSKCERQSCQADDSLPANIAASELSLPKEVQLFLEGKRDYAVRTRTVNIGIY